MWIKKQADHHLQVLIHITRNSEPLLGFGAWYQLLCCALLCYPMACNAVQCGAVEKLRS